MEISGQLPRQRSHFHIVQHRLRLHYILSHPFCRPGCNPKLTQSGLDGSMGAKTIAVVIKFSETNAELGLVLQFCINVCTYICICIDVENFQLADTLAGPFWNFTMFSTA